MADDATTTCPKCEAALPAGRPDCPRCGLLVDRLPADFDPVWGDVADADAALIRRVAERLTAEWGEASGHDRLVELCRQKGRLDLALRFYRQRQKADPDDPVAPDQLDKLDKIVRFTLIEPTEARHDHKGERRRRRWISFALFALIIALAIWYMTTQLSGISGAMQGF